MFEVVLIWYRHIILVIVIVFSPVDSIFVMPYCCFPGWDSPWAVPFQNCVRQPRPPFKMAAVTKNRNLFNCPLLLFFKIKMSSNFNCSYMTMSRLTNILGFSVKFFFQPIYTDYTNYTYFDKRSHLNLLL